jgi:hypothetical protein
VRGPGRVTLPIVDGSRLVTRFSQALVVLSPEPRANAKQGRDTQPRYLRVPHPGQAQVLTRGHPPQPGPAVIASHPGIVAQTARVCQAPGLPLPRPCRPARTKAAPILRSGRIRASAPPLIWSTEISWPGCGACVTSRSPVRKYPRTRDSSSNPRNPIHYEFNLGNRTDMGSKPYRDQHPPSPEVMKG